MEIEDVSLILSGNGDPKKGLVFKVANLEEDVNNMKKTLESSAVLATENNTILKTLVNNKSQRTILGLSPEARSKAWMLFIRFIMTAVGAKMGFDALLK